MILKQMLDEFHELKEKDPDAATALMQDLAKFIYVLQDFVHTELAKDILGKED